MSSIQVERLAVVSLRAQDLPATVHFYRDVIGLRLLPHHGGLAAFSLAEGAHLVILEGEPTLNQSSEDTRFPSVAFAVPDLDAAVEHLRAHGVALPWGVESSQSARYVMFNDPAGNLIELAEFH
jgi:catechol 2,3-dioxygenase-like lactoylglutathione lyase family enzyme